MTQHYKLALPLAAFGVIAAAALTPTSAAPLSGTHQVPNLLLGLARATRLADPAPGSEMSIGVSVARPHPAAEAALSDAQYDPASPEFHRWLTPSTFNTLFGVASSVRAAGRTWLTHTGARIDTESSSGDYLTLTGTVAQLDKLFAVHIGRFSFQGKDLLANTTAPRVPDALPITAVIGLDTGQKWHSTAHRAATATTVEALTEQDLRGVYNAPAKDTGQGIAAGVFTTGDLNPVISDLRVSEKANHQPRVPVKVIRTEKGSIDDFGDNSGTFEFTLDTQALTTMAPDITELDLYNAKHLLDPDIVSLFSGWADDPKGPKEMDASFGSCEYSPADPALEPVIQNEYNGVFMSNGAQKAGDPMLAKGALMGRSVFAASGDTGSGCFELVGPYIGGGQGTVIDPLPIPLWPAISPSVVGVGGTVVTTEAKRHDHRVSETAWTFGGGGPSRITAEPDYQQKVLAVNTPCLTQPDGTAYVPAKICRGGPDVSAISGTGGAEGYAGSTQGMLVYLDDEYVPIYGTSLASPLVEGMWVDAQAAASKRNDLGFANRTFYRLGTNPKTAARDFHDITTSEFGVGNGAYRPGPGWDYATGFGTLDVSNLVQDVNGTTTATGPKATPVGPAVVSCNGRFRTPAGNAYDFNRPAVGSNLSDFNEPTADITAGGLTSTPDGKTIIATLSGRTYSPQLATDATGGSRSYFTWIYRGVPYFAKAFIQTDGSIHYTSGHFLPTGGYVTTANSKATGSFTDNRLTIRVPATEVGSPKPGALLEQPFAQVLDVVGAYEAGQNQVVTIAATDEGATSGALAQTGQSIKVGCGKARPPH